MRITIPADVFAQWAAWIDAGQTERVRADLADLVAKAAAEGLTVARRPGPDPPSSTTPPISTR